MYIKFTLLSTYVVSFLFPIHRHAAEVDEKTNKQDAVVCNYPLVFCSDGTTGVLLWEGE